MTSDRPTLHTTSTRTQSYMGLPPRKAPRRELAELTVALVLFALGVYTAVFTATMEVIGDSEPGPQFFPTIIAVVLFATAIGIVIRVVRLVRAAEVAEVDAAEARANGQPDADLSEETVPHTDWRTLGIVVGTFVAFILVLEPLGWLLSAAGLYWTVATALGAPNRLRTLGVAFVFSAIVQIAFSMGLGLALPTGILGGLL